ncbi:hypothetical protein BDM02DRAFT_3262266 [Thelephora ganbajun]|uniref:Uncharacterized protein n=1 Tax=Thelephora ganbajun TaxID=370292 RepID=A0ACB6ZAA3_THEGA|nr:hypothetical protein BDM02DRAFT_3262266 [Thelephora ganbajun]
MGNAQSNVFIDNNKNATRCNFGLASIAADAESQHASSVGGAEGGTSEPGRDSAGVTKEPNMYSLAMVVIERPKKPEGAVQPGLTNPIWETVETCWETRPSDRLTAAQVLDTWEKGINGGGLPVTVEQGERRRSWTTNGLSVGGAPFGGNVYAVYQRSSMLGDLSKAQEPTNLGFWVTRKKRICSSQESRSAVAKQQGVRISNIAIVKVGREVLVYTHHIRVGLLAQKYVGDSLYFVSSLKRGHPEEGPTETRALVNIVEWVSCLKDHWETITIRLSTRRPLLPKIPLRGSGIYKLCHLSTDLNALF